MKIKLTNSKVEAKDTMSFFWEPETAIKFRPGQFFFITLPKLSVPDSRGATRHFTFSSSPTEGPLFSCTTRIRDSSGFKQTLSKLPKGTIAEFSGPEGTFIIDENEPGPHFLIAGGIGITPFRSILKYQIDMKLKNNVVLLCSNGKPEEVVFADDLKKWTEYKNIEIFHTFSQESGPKIPNAFQGRVSKEIIDKCASLNFLKDATFWISGPPAMVKGVSDLLHSLPYSKKIITESFTGY